MNVLSLSILSFLSGSLMFSYWIGKLLGVDLRNIRDGNPGAFNLWHAKGPFWGFLGVVLDFMKGFLPAFIIIKSGLVSGWGVIPVGIAPVLGHAFSPFMGFKGGKAIDVSFGVWSGIEFFRVSLAWAICLLFLFIIIKIILRREVSPKISATIILMGMLPVSVFMFFSGVSNLIIILWFLNLFLLLCTHHAEVSEAIPFFRQEKTI